MCARVRNAEFGAFGDERSDYFLGVWFRMCVCGSSWVFSCGSTESIEYDELATTIEDAPIEECHHLPIAPPSIEDPL